MRALSTWAGQQKVIRPRLIAAAWRAGERNIRQLAATAGVTRDTVYKDLSAEGIDYSDRSAAVREELITTRADALGLLQVVITTYGTDARERVDEDALVISTAALRDPLTDPEVADSIRRLNGFDTAVRTYVLDSPGALEIVGRNADRIKTLVDGWGNPTGMLVRAHVHCPTGRQRSVVIAEEIATWLRGGGYGVEVDHFDVTGTKST